MTASAKSERSQRNNAIDAAEFALHELDGLLANEGTTEADLAALTTQRQDLVENLNDSRRMDGGNASGLDRSTRDLRRTLNQAERFMELAQDNRIANGGAGVGRVATSVDADSEWGVDGVPDITDGSGIQQLIANDPEGFAELWAATPAEDRQMIMFSLQEHSQVQAQLQTMLTNLLQNQHQATMAIARNLSA